MRQDGNGSGGDSRIEIGAEDSSVQRLAPPAKQRFEGVAFSTSGDVLGVAASDTNTVFLFRRKPDGLFEETPYRTIKGPWSKLSYPHDLSFSPAGSAEILAVVQRPGVISLYKTNNAADDYGTDPVFEIRGRSTGLRYSDGVAFVPPDNEYIAACSRNPSRICFYRKISGFSINFKTEPVFELRYGVSRPDGLAFSRCGEWLAVANHGNHSVNIYRRRKSIFSRGKFKYGPRPVTTIKDPGFRYPHSVAFTPRGNHLVVTNAGANYFSVYEAQMHHAELRWSQSPMLQKAAGPQSIFQEVNGRNEKEGGPKGIAIHDNSLAICSPENGIAIYSLRENP